MSNMSSLQPFSVDNTYSNTTIPKRTGDKRDYGGDTLSSESSNFIPTDHTDKHLEPSSPSTGYGASLFSEFSSVPSSQPTNDLPSSPVRKKRNLGGITFTKKDQTQGLSRQGSSLSSKQHGSWTERTITEDYDGVTNKVDADKIESIDGSVTAPRPSLAAPTTSFRRQVSRNLSGLGSLGSFGETGAGIAGDPVPSPEIKRSKVVDTNLPCGKYLLACADKEVEDIDLMFRDLDKLPPEFGDLKHVVKTNDAPCSSSLTMSYKIMLSHNRLTELEPVLFDKINIHNLSVFNNRLKSVPPRIKDLVNLETLNVSGNPDIKFLPSDIERLGKLRNMKAHNLGFDPLPRGALQPSSQKERKLLHSEVTVCNPDKIFPSLIEKIVTSIFKSKDGGLSKKQIALLKVHQMGRLYFEDAQASYLRGTSCGVCNHHILYEESVYGYALEWWQWPAHAEQGSQHDGQVVVLKRMFCKKACMDRYTSHSMH